MNSITSSIFVLRENSVDYKKLLSYAKKTGEIVKIKESTPVGIVEEAVYYDEKMKLFITHDIFLKDHTINLRSFRRNSAKFIRIKYNFKSGEAKESKGLYYVITSDYHTKTPAIFYSGFNYIGFRLAFLHELYHASHPRHLLNIEDELKENTQDFNRQIKRCLKKNDSNNDEHLTTLFEEYKTYHYENAKEERNATAFAIKIINKFRKKGIDLEPNLKGFKEMDEYIHDPEGFLLGTYELSFQKELEKRGVNKSVISELSGVYSRKTNNIINSEAKNPS